MVFPLLIAAFSTPLYIRCHVVAIFFLFSTILLVVSVASIVQVREEGWTNGMRESGLIDQIASESDHGQTLTPLYLHFFPIPNLNFTTPATATATAQQLTQSTPTRFLFTLFPLHGS
ncbi:hypothetical protein QVD17_42032 [Tagetes erecta]|uniref:Uncharacterized protein n=1 Tax=Tagetes erecta TaxID=13708 RepID=A0AAD8NFY6_TARER|nr:hypothetical protein QVD17_42032 [Tagetes erecta]